MEIKTAEEVLNKYIINRFDDIDTKTFIDAMQAYAKQFIDLAAEKAEMEDINEEHVIGVRVNKQSILDIKQLIK